MAENFLSFNETVHPKKASSFDQVEETPKVEKSKLITRSDRIDRFNTKRTREILSPSMCIKAGCRYDAARAMHFGGWEDLSPTNQQVALELLGEHINKIHTTFEDHIVDEDDLPGNWLGGARDKTF